MEPTKPFPRRNRLDLNEPAELAIRNAVSEVEKMPADVRLTNAVVLLDQARWAVADFIDNKKSFNPFGPAMAWIKAIDGLPKNPVSRQRVSIKFKGSPNFMVFIVGYGEIEGKWCWSMAYNDSKGKHISEEEFQHIEWLSESEPRKTKEEIAYKWLSDYGPLAYQTRMLSAMEEYQAQPAPHNEEALEKMYKAGLHNGKAIGRREAQQQRGIRYSAEDMFECWSEAQRAYVTEPRKFFTDYIKTLHHE